MISLTRPTQDLIQMAYGRMNQAPFNYSEVGSTREMTHLSTPPAGFNLDCNRIQIGQGSQTFESGCKAIRSWTMFANGWTFLSPSQEDLTTDTLAAMVTKICGMWWLNVCRVVYLVNEEKGSVKRYGFAYGTLPEHVESGEERFLIEWDRESDEVSYEILAFSRPRHPLVWLGKPWARKLQNRFAKESLDLMKKAALCATKTES